MDKVVAVIETVKLPSDSQRPAVVGDKFESVDRYVGGEWPLVLPAAEQHDRLVLVASVNRSELPGDGLQRILERIGSVLLEGLLCEPEGRTVLTDDSNDAFGKAVGA